MAFIRLFMPRCNFNQKIKLMLHRYYVGLVDIYYGDWKSGYRVLYMHRASGKQQGNGKSLINIAFCVSFFSLVSMDHYTKFDVGCWMVINLLSYFGNMKFQCFLLAAVGC